jgi:hypothetical protein
MAGIKYKFGGNIFFDIFIAKDKHEETVQLELNQFYDLYNLVVDYSMDLLSNQNSQPNRKSNPEKKKSVNGEDENKCSICLDKEIDVVLPCFVILT